MTDFFYAGTEEYCITFSKEIAMIYRNNEPWIVTRHGRNTHYATPYGFVWFNRH